MPPNEPPTRPWIRVCAYCGAVRTVWPDGTERWIRPGAAPLPEEHLSHGICPRCFRGVMEDLAERFHKRHTVPPIRPGA
ncbi:MAG: hypothetical protein Kow0092_06640 [Deferrisomatales bacterium]